MISVKIPQENFRKLNMAGIVTLIKNLLNKEDAEKFALWAFGENYRNIDYGSDAHIYWNNLHKDKLELQGNGYPSDDIPKMIKLWKDEVFK